MHHTSRNESSRRVQRLSRLASGLTLVIVASCARDDPASAEVRASTQSEETYRELAKDASRVLGLDVISVTLGRHRADLVVSAPVPAPSPDHEYASLRRAADWLWLRSPFDQVADTIAITVSRTLRTDSLTERNTYFYYRTERRSTRP